MGTGICKNCNKTYNIKDKDSDMDYCSFSCWEKVNCVEPPKVSFEDLIITELN
jgi:hypothetical protein